jgi:hypothetical protein
MAILQEISKAVRDPNHFADHKHRGLLWRILLLLLEMELPLVMYKVKSHVGIVGNELADIAAKMGLDSEHARLVTDGAEPHLEDTNPYWLKYQPTGKGEDTELRPQIVGDLKEQLSRICYAELKLGRANQEAIYYQTMQQALPDMLLDISNKWRTSQTVPPAARRTAMAYHNGTLYNQSMAKREKRTDSDACILCGQTDSRQHAVSGCPAMSDMVTERHHGAVRLITKEIMRGRHGAALLMMDAGRLEKRKRDGVDLATSIPTDLLPGNVSQAELKKLTRTLKPDILLKTKQRAKRTGDDPKPKTKGPVVRIVEVKYCKDTDKTKQEERASEQHARLTALLKQNKQEVQQHTILLGVGGTIYKDTLNHLKALGIDKDRAVKLVERLSAYAVTQMRNIIHTRRALEAAKLKSTGQWKQWRPKGGGRDPAPGRGRKRRTKGVG